MPTPAPDDYPAEWDERARRAVAILHDLRPGDQIRFADRSLAMTVKRIEEDENGHRIVDVEGARGGTYVLREKYDSRGQPKLTSDIGRANDLVRVDEADPDADLDLDASLSERQYEELVADLTERVVDAFMRFDYGSLDNAVTDVVNEWLDDVAFHRWNEHLIAYHDDAPAEIYRSVLEHSGEFPEIDLQGVETTPRTQAEAVLIEAIHDRAKPHAERSLITSLTEYDETVEKLAHHSIDRFEEQNYPSARIAVRDTVSNFLDQHSEIVAEAILEYGDAPEREDEDDLYSGMSAGAIQRERAYDTLDRDVWTRVSEIQRDRGEHDPTKRGLTYQQFEELAEALTEQTLRRHHVNAFVRTTANDVVEAWADDVEAHEWDGHRFDVWAPTDPDDIFASATMHARDEPVKFNPFSSRPERSTAIQVLTTEVQDRASRALKTEGDAEPVPADEYLQNVLGLDLDYADIVSEGVDERDIMSYLGKSAQTLDGDEVGWTFVDELVWGGGAVPQQTPEWVLLDYGLIREGDIDRQAAWFHRETGDVLILRGEAEEGATVDSESTSLAPGSFSVALAPYRGGEVDFLLTDADATEALEYAYDHVGTPQSNIHIYEDSSGDRYVLDNLSERDIDTSGALSQLIPNFSVPGANWTTSDMFSASEQHIKGAAHFSRRWASELRTFSAFGVMTAIPYIGQHLSQVDLRPYIHKQYGPGVKGSYVYGDDPDSNFTGKVDATIHIKPETLGELTDSVFEKTGVKDRMDVDRLDRARRRLTSPLWSTTNWFRQQVYPLSAGIIQPSWDELPSHMKDQYTNMAEVRRWAGLNDAKFIEVAETLNDGRYPSYTKWIQFRLSLDLRRVPFDDVLDDKGQATFWEMFPDTMHSGTRDQFRDGNAPRSWLQEFMRVYAPDLSKFIHETRSVIAEEQEAELDEYVDDITRGQADEQRRHFEAVADAADVPVDELVRGDPSDDDFDWFDVTPTAAYEDARSLSEPDEQSGTVGDFVDLSDLSAAFKRPSTGLDFDALDRADPNLSRLFLRGANMEYAAKTGRHLNIDRIRGRLPFVSNNPMERPSFEEWREKRYGYTMDGPNPDEVDQWARYQQEVGGSDEPDADEMLGTRVDPADLRDHDFDTAEAQGDYYQGTYFAKEYGSEFDDVAAELSEE